MTKEQLQKLEELNNNIVVNHAPRLTIQQRSDMLLSRERARITTRKSKLEWEYQRDINMLRTDEVRLAKVEDCLHRGGYYLLVSQHDCILRGLITPDFTAFEEILPEVTAHRTPLVEVSRDVSSSIGYYIYEVTNNGLITFLRAQVDSSD